VGAERFQKEDTMLVYLIGAVIVFGIPFLILAIRSRELRKFLAGSFFVSGGFQFYFWQAKLDIPLYNTGAVQTPDLSLTRSIIHLTLFLICLYTGFFWKPKPKQSK
jgi:hypothetical protein